MQKKNEYNLAFSLADLIHQSSVSPDRFWDAALDLAVLVHMQIDVKLIVLERDLPEINRQIKEKLSSSSLTLEGIDVYDMLPRLFELKEHELQEIYKEFSYMKLQGMNVSAALYAALSELQEWSLSAPESLVLLIENLVAPKGSEKILLAGESCVGAAYLLSVLQNNRDLNLLPLVGRKKIDQLRKLLFIERSEVKMITQKEIPFISNEASFDSGILMDAFNAKKFIAPIPSRKYKNLSSEVSQLEFFLDHTQGKVVVLVPMGWLWKTAGDDFLLKKELLNSGKIEAVIQLPSKILKGANIQTALVVLDTVNKHEKVIFVDASNEYELTTSKQIELINLEENLKIIEGKNDVYSFSSCVEIERIIQNNIILDPNRYIYSDQEAYYINNFLEFYKDVELVRLDSIAEVIVCQPIKLEVFDAWDDGQPSDIKPLDIIDTHRPDRLGQIRDGRLSAKIYYPLSGQERQINRQRLQENDLLFSNKGVIGKCAIVPKDCERMVAAQSFLIIRLKEELKETYPAALFFYLQSGVCHIVISKRITGGAMKFIKTEDIRSLKVPMPSVEEQKKYQAEYQRLVDLEHKLKVFEDDIEESLRMAWD